MPPIRAIRSLLCLLCIVSAPAALAAIEAAEPIVVKEPEYGEVLFYFYQEDYFPAIARLLAARKQDKLREHADEAELLLGGMFLSYGHHLEAAEIFSRLLADNVSPEIRDRTWFFLARIWYQRGYLDKAQQALANIGADLPDNLRREALMLDAQIQIDAGKYDTAIARLQNWDGRTEWASYAKFNIGVALVRSGRVEEAARLLDELGSMDPFTEELAALRDKANLALGYALLQDGQPYAAKSPLQRVRLAGPFSNKALLGVGWADAEMDNFRRALVPWSELRGRDLLDSAVQESMLAIPYALARLDSISQAADHYLNAIEAFYEEANRLDYAIERIESGRFFDAFVEDEPLDSMGWFWDLEALPEGIEARYLLHVMTTHEFQEGLKNYRDLSYLLRNLDVWRQNIDVYSNMLEARKEKYQRSLEDVEAALAMVAPEDLVERKLSLDSVLDNIAEDHDWLALATKPEVDLWNEITSLEETPALRADIPEAAEVRDKIDLLKGVMQWQLERDFRARLTQARREQQKTGEALVATQRAWRQIEEVMREEPLRLDGFSARVDGLAPRIDGLQARVRDALARQRAFLQEIAIGELQVQKERLDVYTIQARFALAAIYDISALSEEEAE